MITVARVAGVSIAIGVCVALTAWLGFESPAVGFALIGVCIFAGLVGAELVARWDRR